MTAFLRTSLILAALLMGLPGCSSYQAVQPAPERIRIALLPVVNESDLPQVIAPLSRNLREELAHSPNWELVASDRAEALLMVTILSSNRQAISRDPQDTGRPISYREEVVVEVEWKSELPCPWGPSSIFTISSDHILYAQPSLTDARTSATASMADRIAAKIVERMDWSSTISRGN